MEIIITNVPSITEGKSKLEVIESYGYLFVKYCGCLHTMNLIKIPNSCNFPKGRKNVKIEIDFKDII